MPLHFLFAKWFCFCKYFTSPVSPGIQPPHSTTRVMTSGCIFAGYAYFLLLLVWYHSACSFTTTACLCTEPDLLYHKFACCFSHWTLSLILGCDSGLAVSADHRLWLCYNNYSEKIAVTFIHMSTRLGFMKIFHIPKCRTCLEKCHCS